MEEVTVKETKREVIKQRDKYILNVVQEYPEANVKNMVESWKATNERMTKWQDSISEQEESAVEMASQNISATREQITIDLTLSNEEILEKWQQEIKKKMEWLENADNIEKRSIEQIKLQFQKMRENCLKELSINKQSIEVWDNAIHS